MQLFAVDMLNSTGWTLRTSVLRKNKVEFYDSMYDPFVGETDVQEFLDISQSV